MNSENSLTMNTRREEKRKSMAYSKYADEFVKHAKKTKKSWHGAGRLESVEVMKSKISKMTRQSGKKTTARPRTNWVQNMTEKK